MIFRGMCWLFEDTLELWVMAMFFGVFLSIIGINNTLNVISGFGFLALLILLTEISYHLEPRTKEDKKKGRSYWRVLSKKIDSAADAIILIIIGVLIYELVVFLTMEHIIRALQIIGTIVASAMGIMLYLWINRLRDRPKKKIKKGKKKK